MRALVGTDGTTASPPATAIGRFVRRFVRDHRVHWVLVSPHAHAPVPLLPGIVVRPFAAPDHTAIVDDGDFASALRHADGGARGHVLEFAGEIASVAHYVDRSLHADGAIWPLMRDEIVLAHVATRPAFRGLGFASTLIAHATPPALARRANAAIGFVWWNHRASLRAFHHAGWRTVGLSIELTRANGRTIRFHIPLAQRRRLR